MIECGKYSRLTDHIITMKQASLDNRDGVTNKYMTASCLPVVDFDAVKNKYISGCI